MWRTTVSGNDETMTPEKALAMAKECLLIRADQWREMADIEHVDLEELYEATTEERRAMAELYKAAYVALCGEGSCGPSELG